MHEEICNLEEKIKIMEEVVERQNEASERQNLEYKEKLKLKDGELRTSRDQVSQLLRIIEQITKVHNKSSIASKTSESEDNH
jgi:TRAP-type C4-dicarboxylate transport system substrate-binding protein